MNCVMWRQIFLSEFSSTFRTLPDDVTAHARQDSRERRLEVTGVPGQRVLEQESHCNDCGKKYPIPTGGELTSSRSGALLTTGPSTRNVIVREGEIGVASRTSVARNSRDAKDENPQEQHGHVRST